MMLEFNRTKFLDRVYPLPRVLSSYLEGNKGVENLYFFVKNRYFF